MKEFLEPLPNGDFRYHKDSGGMIGGDWIEIPDGAEVYIKLSERNQSFYKNDFASCFFDGEWLKTKCNLENRKIWNLSLVLWKREKVEVEDKKLDMKKVMAEAEMFDASNREHSHYYKDVSNLNIIDPYMVLKLFDVKDPCLQHIVKKALVAGGRGHKDFERDLKDIHDTSKRALEINNILH